MEKKPFICVYAICKNEEKFIDRWISSLKEADCIVVLDTGSTDRTVELLEQYSPFVTVHQEIIEPWRFDTARNKSMEYIPPYADICVISDCDQVFRAGWADELRRLFNEGYEEVYGPIIDYDDDNNEIKRFLSKNVHGNTDEWWWERPIHEGIEYHGDREIKTITSENFVIEHHPDRTKSRDHYLTLLEEEYKENSSDPMCAIYYGCELTFHGRNEEGLKVFLKAVKECDFTNHKEVGYQINLNISDEYASNGKYFEALDYAFAATKFGVETRRLYMQISDIYYLLKEYDRVVLFAFKALSIKEQDQSWIETESLFGGHIYDHIARAYYEMQRYDMSIKFGLLAITKDPDVECYRNNMKYYLDKYMDDIFFHGGVLDNEENMRIYHL